MIKIMAIDGLDLENNENKEYSGNVCEVGKIVDGVVSGTAKFGAFVDLPNGQRGLVHISQISEDYVREVRDYLDIGQKVKVYIMEREGDKIRLSIKKANKQLGLEQLSDRRLGGTAGGLAVAMSQERRLNNMIDRFMRDSENSKLLLSNRYDGKIR